jgi:hypothetical protein
MQLGRRFVLILLKSMPSVSLYIAVPKLTLKSIKGVEPLTHNTQHIFREEEVEGLYLTL